MARKTVLQQPIHPGEVLRIDFLEALELSPDGLAKAIHVPLRHVTGIIKKERGINADTALRLGRFFGTSGQFWMNLQSRFDLEVAQDRLGKRLTREVAVHAA